MITPTVTDEPTIAHAYDLTIECQIAALATETMITAPSRMRLRSNDV